MGETVGEQMASGKIPFMITKKMRAQLKEEAGLSEESIRKLTPQQANDTLSKITKVNFQQLGDESDFSKELYGDLENAIKKAGLSEDAIRKLTPLQAQEILQKT